VWSGVQTSLTARNRGLGGKSSSSSAGHPKNFDHHLEKGTKKEQIALLNL
jgi:hypothetical protein